MKKKKPNQFVNYNELILLAISVGGYCAEELEELFRKSFKKTELIDCSISQPAIRARLNNLYKEGFLTKETMLSGKQKNARRVYYSLTDKAIVLREAYEFVIDEIAKKNY